MRWWAEAAELWVQGQLVHQGDLFDSSCRWFLPDAWWQGGAWSVELRLRSPKHDDGALVLSQLVLEPLDPADPQGILAPTVAVLQSMRREAGFAAGLRDGAADGSWQVLGHAHLDLAWLWPVADTWQAAERTFHSVLTLMEHQSQLHFGHSTPALYAWLQEHRPALYGRIREAMRRGRWEPLHGPWVECDCVLIGTLSLLRQFQEGQWFSRAAFPEWTHPVAWLPDSFGFSAGLPPVAAATGVRWFCTHKLAWNGSNPFPHRLFRWRGRCGKEVLALMTAPIGTDGDPVAMERYRLAWQKVTGVGDALWLPGVGDHGGGPTLEMLEQLALWQGRDGTAPQQHGTLRAYLSRLEPLAPTLPVWRDELYLELHRGCATSRPDQKRHNRTLERLLREADTALALLASAGGGDRSGSPQPEPTDWRPLLFQQFHDILPGTSIPEVFEQAEPQWRGARRCASRARDRALMGALAAPGAAAGSSAGAAATWAVVQLHPLPAEPLCLRLPAGRWSQAGRPLPSQPAADGGVWLQLQSPAGVGALQLRREPAAPPQEATATATATATAVIDPVRLEPQPRLGPDHWRLDNGLVGVLLGPAGVEQLFDAAGQPRLAGPARWCRWTDRGEFWDAWDIAADHRDHPLPWRWDGPPRWRERGPLCASFLQCGWVGESPVRLLGRLRAGSPWLELTLSLHWRQRHELLRLELPLADPACRWAADTAGGLIERPADPRTARERVRWEVPAISWLASQAPATAEASGPGLAVLLAGPQGVSADAGLLGVSLLRGPTWPDPGADNGWQRQRLALMPLSRGWRQERVPRQARRLREPLWCRPLVPAADAPEVLLPPLEDDLELVQLRREGSALQIAVQNLGPCRRHLDPGSHWRIGERLNGLGEVSAELAGAELGPWQLGFWRLLPAQSS
jgi:alpha-mannosidase